MSFLQSCFNFAILCTCLLSGCASSNPSTEGTPDAPESTKVLALKTEGYQNLSIKDFNAIVATEIEENKDFLSIFSDFMGTLTPEDSDYSFVYETLNYSINEIILPILDESVSYSGFLKKEDNIYHGQDSGTFYDFIFLTNYSVEYQINNDVNLTVQERDQLLKEYQSKLQNTISNMSNEELQAGDVRQTLQGMANDLTERLSTATLTFKNVKIQSIEIYDGNQVYQK